MLRLKKIDKSNKNERMLKVYETAGGQKQTRDQPGRSQCRAGGGDLVAVRPAAA
jgi:hypothetical protein